MDGIVGEECACDQRTQSGVLNRNCTFDRQANGWLAAALVTLFLLGSVLAPAAHAQVALAATTSSSGNLTSGANTLTFAHTSTGTNLVR